MHISHNGLHNFIYLVFESVILSISSTKMNIWAARRNHGFGDMARDDSKYCEASDYILMNSTLKPW